MKIVAALAFLSGIILAVRVMLFGVRRRIGPESYSHRAWPLALAAALVASGVMSYARAFVGREVTAPWTALVLVVGAAAGAAAWWTVRVSAAVTSTDPEDDPRYRFQGHVAKVIAPIGATAAGSGRIGFDFDGRRLELLARWVSDGEVAAPAGAVASEVVIERVEGDVAYVEPWGEVERRL